MEKKARKDRIIRKHRGLVMYTAVSSLHIENTDRDTSCQLHTCTENAIVLAHLNSGTNAAVKKPRNYVLYPTML